MKADGKIAGLEVSTRLNSTGVIKPPRRYRSLRSRAMRSEQFKVLSLAIASIAAVSSTAYAVDTADNVLTTATAPLDTAANFSLGTLPAATSDMVFVNGVYGTTAFTLNTTALTPGTLDDLNTTQFLSISGSKSITLKTLANGVAGTAVSDLLYVANGANFNISTPVSLGVTGGNFDIAGTAAITGNLNGSTATFNITKTGIGTLTLGGIGTYTGSTTVNNGTLKLDFSSATAPTNNIIAAASPLVLGGSTLLINNSAAASNAQTFASTSLNGSNILSINTTAGLTTTVNLGAISQTAIGTTLQILPNGSGTLNINGSAGTNVTGTAAAPIASTTAGYVSGAFVSYGLSDFAMISSGTIVPLGINYVANTSTTGNIDVGAGFTSATATTSVNAMRFNSSGSATVTIRTVYTTGGIMVTPNVGPNNQYFGSSGTTHEIEPNRSSTSGSEAVIWQNNTAGYLVFSSGTELGNGKTGSASWVQAGPGTVQYIQPVGTTNNFSGNMFLDGGYTLVSANGNAVFGATAANAVQLNGGTIVAGSTFTMDNGTTARPVNLLNAGGGLSAIAGTVLTVDGAVTSALGAGPLTIGIPASAANGNVAGQLPGTGTGTANAAVAATGTVALSYGPGNSFTGGTIITGGATGNVNGFYALGGANYGGLTLNNGTLQYAQAIGSTTGGTDFTFGTGLTIASGGGTIDLNGNAVGFANTIKGGSGLLSVTSTDTNHAGVLTLGGTNSLAGGISVANAGLSVTGTLSSTTLVTVNAGGILSGTGNAGSVTIAGGTIASGLGNTYIGQLSANSITYNSGTLQFGVGPGSAGNISTGSAIFNAVPAINFVITGSPTSGAVYTVLTSASPITDNGFLSALPVTTIGRLTLTPTENSPNTITVKVAGTAGNLIWQNGANTGLWNITTDKNFLNTATSAQDVYYEADNVTFNDNNGGAANYTVGIATAVNPATVNVNNSGGTYVFNGPGYIAGSTSLVKAGTGILTLNTLNTYTGGTMINAGTVQVGVAGALPVAGTVTVAGTGGILDLDGNNQTIGGLSDGGVSTGTLTSSVGTPILTLSSTAATNSFSGLITGSLGLNKIGSSIFTLSGANTYTGLTNISNGTLVIANNTALGSTNSSTGGLYTIPGGVVNFTTAAPVIAALGGTGGSVVLAAAGGTTLTVGGGNQTTTFAGLLSDQAGSGSVGNLAVVGSGTLTLTGANTFTGITTVGGTSTLTLANALALQDSTVNYNNQGGTLSFGTLTAATIAGLTGSQSLSLSNTASGAVALSIGNNNVTSTYSGALNGSGSLLKIGTGNLTLSGVNTYTGTTTVSNAGVLTLTGTIGAGPTLGAVTVNPGATLNVSGGSLIASALSLAQNAALSTVNVINNGSINVSTGTITQGSDSGASGQILNVFSGTVTANAYLVGRDGAATATLITTDPNAGGLNVNGSSAVVNITTTLGIGAFSNANSDAAVQLEQGTINVGGLTTITQNNTRTSFLDVAGGTFNGTGGVQIGGTYAAPFAEFLVHGGVANVAFVSFGNANTTGGTDVLELGGGTLYVDAGGIYNNSSITPTINLGAVAFATAPTLAASAPWSSSLAMTITNSSSGLLATIQAANSSTGAVNISLSGNLTGTGGLIKTGAGVLTFSGSNTYSGPTNVSAGTLVSSVLGALPSGNKVTVSAGATLVSDSQATVLSLGSLTIDGNMIVHGGVLKTLTQEAGEGYASGTWAGTGSSLGVPIVSDLAASDTAHLHAIGVIQNDNGMGTSTALYGTFKGQTVTDSDILVKYTYYGDANLDGIVDGSDYSRIDATYLAEQTGGAISGWFNGDFNYDGVVNGSDYTLIDNAFNTQSGVISSLDASPTAEIAGAVVSSAVPEPASLGLIGIGAVGLLGRRRRRSRGE